MSRIHTLLGIQSLVAILVSINRLGTWTLGYVLPNEFLRWVDFNNMLVLPPDQRGGVLSSQENYRISVASA